VFVELRAINPKDAEARYALANWLERKGDSDGAIAEYRVALKLRPRSENQHYNFGIRLMKKGDIDAAIAGYKEALHEGLMSRRRITVGPRSRTKGRYVCCFEGI
jgi:Flp pilus assembly protein TadD